MIFQLTLRAPTRNSLEVDVFIQSPRADSDTPRTTRSTLSYSGPGHSLGWLADNILIALQDHPDMGKPTLLIEGTGRFGWRKPPRATISALNRLLADL